MVEPLHLVASALLSASREHADEPTDASSAGQVQSPGDASSPYRSTIVGGVKVLVLPPRREPESSALGAAWVLSTRESSSPGIRGAARTARLPLLMPVTRVAKPADAEALFAVAAEAIAGYREWAPSDWAPPVPSPADASRLAGALARTDVWCLVALAAEKVIGHVALSPFTVEDPEPPPAGTINLWQLFVRPGWQGQGVATELIDAAVGEAQRRGFTRMRLWTPRGAARARRFYEREGWVLTGGIHEDSPFGLPVLEYARSLDSPD